jgi:LPS O-antigen subunit length determinant protein (WzzB/FepE family)
MKDRPKTAAVVAMHYLIGLLVVLVLGALVILVLERYPGET